MHPHPNSSCVSPAKNAVTCCRKEHGFKFDVVFTSESCLTLNPFNQKHSLAKGFYAVPSWVWSKVLARDFGILPTIPPKKELHRRFWEGLKVQCEAGSTNSLSFWLLNIPLQKPS